MPNILVSNNFYQGTSSACIIDLTPPTFAGVASTVVQSRGQIRTSWLAATDSTPPIRYEVYIQATTPTGLFNTANICGITDKLLFDTWTTPDGAFLVNGTTYYMGVRAVDAVGNRDSNLVSQSVISTGVFVSADVYDAEGAFAINSSNQLQGTLWCLKNSILAKTGNATMGTASYQIYDKTGALVSGMTESGITADANGQYKITPVASVLAKTLEHYMVKVNITVDGAIREGYVALIQPIPEYDVEGAFILNSSNQLTGSFWGTADEETITNPARLGSAAYEIYDGTGTLVPSMTQSGITADGQGLYEITPVTSSLNLDLNNYYVKVTVTIDNILRNYFLPILGKIPRYETKAVFSINGANQLQATIWAVGDNLVVSGSRLGQANYTVYDSSGVAVVGLTQSGITADVNGRFLITPASATLLTDLTHYTVKIGIVIDGVERVSYKGFTLLGN